MKESTWWTIMAAVWFLVLMNSEGELLRIALAGEVFSLAVSSILRAIERRGDDE